MHEDELKRELERLSARLSRIEQRLGIAAEPPRAPVAPTPVAPPPVAHARPSPPPPPPPTTPLTSTAQEVVGDKCAPFKRLQANWHRQGDESNITPPVSPSHPPIPSMRPNATLSATPVEKSIGSTSLEMAIGGKLMAWIGALTVLIAVGFAIMVGVQRGWWGQLSPQFRCLLIAGFGAALLIGGEISLRRLGRAASVGLFSAGLGTLYMDAFATFRYFHLLDSQWAFVLMAAVAIIGFAITLRTRFLTIGVLSIVGGYLTPILLHGQVGQDLELLSYLTMLFAVSLGLSAVLPRDFRPLRYVGLGGLILLGGLWILGNARSLWLMAVFFAGVWWAMTVAEALWAAIRRQTPLGNVVMVVIGTAAFVVGGCWVLRLGPSVPGFPTGTTGAMFSSLVVANWLGIFTFMTAVLSGAITWQYGPDVRELRQPLRNAMDKLALALWAQMGVLIVVAIGLQFRGFAQSIGWLAIGLAAIEIGRRLPARGVTIFGLAVGGMGVFRVAVLDWWITPGMNAALWTVGGVEISRWSILGLVTIVAAHFAAHRVWMPGRPAREFWSVALAAIGTVGWLIVCSTQARGLTATTGWLIGAATLLALSYVPNVGRRQAYVESAVFVLLLAITRWLMLDALQARLDQTWRADAMLPLFNAQVGVAVLIGVLAWWAHRIIQSRVNATAAETVAPQRLARIGGPLQALAFVFMLIVLSFELDRTLARMVPLPQWLAEWGPVQVRMLLLTALWGAGGLGMLRIGQLRNIRFLGGAGFLILAACALAWLTVDTIVWRVQQGVVNAPVIFNLQFIVGALMAALLAIAVFWLKRDTSNDLVVRDNIASAVRTSLAVIGAIGLVAGTLEIDRALDHDPMLRQVGWSVFWGLYGVALVVLGFMRRTSAVRYAGLALLALVAGKVMLIDFAYLEDVPRVISTLVAGLLFIGTSMLYFKLAPRLQQRAS